MTNFLKKVFFSGMIRSLRKQNCIILLQKTDNDFYEKTPIPSKLGYSIEDNRTFQRSLMVFMLLHLHNNNDLIYHLEISFLIFCL